MDTKPEPIAAKPNWHYDSYFLDQLKRLNSRKLDKSLKLQVKQAVEVVGDETEQGNKL